MGRSIKENIAIIGCGYVGSAVARVWTQAGHSIAATTTTPTKVAKLEKIVQKVVVTKADNLDRLLDVIQDRDTVLLSVGAPNRSAYRESYLETAQNLAIALKQTPRVKQLIYTGSYGVCGNRNGEWVDEESSITPPNEHGEILHQTEQALLSINSADLKVCILRLAGIYGPGRRQLIKIFGSWAGTTRPGNREAYINWVHLDDIVSAIEFVRQNKLQGMYNLSSDMPLKRQEFYDRLFQHHGQPSVTWDASTLSTPSYGLRLSNQKIKAAGFKLIHPEILF